VDAPEEIFSTTFGTAEGCPVYKSGNEDHRSQQIKLQMLLYLFRFYEFNGGNGIKHACIVDQGNPSGTFRIDAGEYFMQEFIGAGRQREVSLMVIERYVQCRRRIHQVFIDGAGYAEDRIAVPYQSLYDGFADSLEVPVTI
jgi:hypothetical protein